MASSVIIARDNLKVVEGSRYAPSRSGSPFVDLATSARLDTHKRNRNRDHAQRAHDHCATATSPTMMPLRLVSA
jgi:hypothetical protein